MPLPQLPITSNSRRGGVGNQVYTTSKIQTLTNTNLYKASHLTSCHMWHEHGILDDKCNKTNISLTFRSRNLSPL